MTTRIGIDTGGTFTDFVLLDDKTGMVSYAKVASTPTEPAQAIGAGIAQLAMVEAVEHVVVGTTVATNAIIERRGPTVVFVTNEGFEDVPFIARLDKERLYDLHWRKPKPLVRRRDCVGIGGRVNHRGEVLEVLGPESLAALNERLGEYDSTNCVVAICCLFSYLRPDDERDAAAAARLALPNAAISVSHDVSPIWREYERASTTIADAFVKPIVGTYVDGVRHILGEVLGIDRWNLLASNGGYLRADEALSRPVHLALSGLAGGIIGARFFAEAASYPSVFSLDMGGTSCDIGLILEGAPQYAGEFNLAWGLPVSIPCVSVDTIGSGGGSIAWIDKGGLLRVGPQSAGAVPGPVAYGTGGSEPTVTDANLILGRLDAEYFLDGSIRLDSDGARTALSALGERLGMGTEEAAHAVCRTADESMANAIRLIAVERGLRLRDFALMAFGGAGPLHARAVAERLDMDTVLIPPHPGLCSAFGSMIAQPRVDRLRTYYARSDHVDLAELATVERELRESAIAELRRSVDVERPLIERSAAMRYAAQNYELEIPLPPGDIDESCWTELLSRFEAEYHRKYGFVLSGEAIELINLRATALREGVLPIIEVVGDGNGNARTKRLVWFAPDGATLCPIYRRADLAAGTEVKGPAVIEEPDSTMLAFPGDRVLVHTSGVLILTIGRDV